MWNRGARTLAVALLLTGCVVQSTPTAAPTAPPSAQPAEPGSHDCGTLLLRQGQTVPTDALRCVVEAADNRQQARLVVTQPTTEGDPITTTYAVLGDGRVEVTTDARADRFGSGRVERQTCTGPSIEDGSRLSFATCVSGAPV
ncbi:hypothetical protein GA0070620_4034 [Micromonospora krabiensis]|uniref:Uncharacterized protein n=1 Tax=Micromonospora krabiensis TaxID=307121 RepID=A0A1C3N7E9_9ACTN|nr:hypothetical protein GA0070620_4034 [Micromonospora krabiensis]